MGSWEPMNPIKPIWIQLDAYPYAETWVPIYWWEDLTP